MATILALTGLGIMAALVMLAIVWGAKGDDQKRQERADARQAARRARWL